MQNSQTRRLITVAAMAVGIVVALTGCVAPTGSDAPRGTLVVNISQAPGTIDPAQACESPDLDLAGNLYARLVQYGTVPGPDNTQQFDPSTLEPWLAESWDISEDGLVYTFNLVEGAVFPSGSPMDAEAVKYSFDRVIQTNGCGLYFVYDGLYDPPMISSVDVVDATTVAITLNAPNANALQDWAQVGASIVDRTVVEANGGVIADTVNEWMASNSAGGGAYLLEEYLPGTRAVLVANKTYFDKAPASSRIVINYTTDNAALQLQAKSGAADVTLGMSKKGAASLAKGEKTRIVANDSTQATQVRINSSAPGLESAQVRQALIYAVPFDDIINTVADGYGEGFDGPFAPIIPQFDPALGAQHVTDSVKAAELLAESGVHLPLALELIVSDGLPGGNQIATILQSVWGDLGITLTVKTLASADFVERNNTSDYQLSLAQDGPGVVDGGFYLAYATGCADAFIGYSVCVPGVDELLSSARAEVDPVEQQRIYNQITSLWIDHGTMIQLYADKTITVLSKDVTSYTYSPTVDLRSWAKK